MTEYLLLILSVFLLACSFLLQKLYQTGSESSHVGGINFSILSAFFSLILLLIMNRFSPEFSLYSLINSVLRSACCLAYTVIGFHIMKKGHVALYMLFLMSGGMALPALWGWFFLGEAVLPLHVIGIILILVSIVISKLDSKLPDRSMLLCCFAVFVLNGFVSVLSKLHQVNEVYPTVSTEGYALYGTLASLVMSLLLRAILLRTERSAKATEETPKKTAWKRVWLPLLIVAAYSVLGSLSSLLQLRGAKLLPASLLYPVITGGNIVLTAIFARIFFRERPSRTEWIGIALCALGTLLFL